MIKVNRQDRQKRLGFTSKSPRWAISYKFETEQAVTTLNSVVYQVGRTGALTPVANLEPVSLLGTTVKRASLHNKDQIEKLDLYIGDQVFVEKGGEIIPKVVGVEFKDRNLFSHPTKFITQCPECNNTTDNHEPLSIITLTLKSEYNSLYDCIDEYVKKISLDDDNKLKCEDGKQTFLSWCYQLYF